MKENIMFIENPIKISIIIPTYNHLEDCLKPCLDSIKKYTNLNNIEVLVVANGCKDDTANYVNSLGNSFKLIWFDNGLGYTKATNEGIKQSVGEYIILLNNDTVLLDQPINQWIDMLIDPFKDNTVGITGPMYVNCPYASRDFLIFFCVMIKRELFNKIGLLDEIFSPGFGEDSDFGIKTQDLGYKIVQVPNKSDNYCAPNYMVGSFPIYHKGEGTFANYPEGNRILAERRFILMNRYNKNIKLNLGSGDKRVDGYINVDIENPNADIHWDVRKLPLNDNKVDEILAVHLFEHFKPEESIDILKEWYRLLKPYGKLILEMPDIEQLCKSFIDGDKSERYHMLNCIYGSMMPEFPHRYGWYFEILQDHLKQVGFSNIVKSDAQFYHWGHNFRITATKTKELPEGFFSDSDIDSYRNLIKDRVPNGGIIAELGSWQGKSICSIADIIKEKNLRVVIIDTFEGSNGEEAIIGANKEVAKQINLKQVFINNCNDFDIYPEIYQGTTHDMSSKFLDNYFDFVFIDADHSYDGALQDIQDWWPKVKRGGILADHDCCWKSVADALTHEFGHLVLTNKNNIWFIDKHKVYDCFTFHNELDQLEIRLNELNNEVDHFIIVEGTETHSGKPKELIFKNNINRFKKFLPKIKYIIIDNWPEYIEGNSDSAWVRERMQRDAILTGLHDARFCDVVIISDVDEIPNAKAVREYKRYLGISSLEMNLYYYYINYVNVSDNKWCEGKILSIQEMKDLLPTQVRYFEKNSIIKDGGWHFSYQGGIDAIINKIESYAHQEYNTPEYKNKDNITKLINDGKDIFGRESLYKIIDIDETYPKYILNNIEKFDHMIKVKNEY